MNWLLLEPLAPDFAGAQRLLISTDGRLADVPFAALRTRDGRYLVQDVDLVFVQGLLPSEPSRSSAVATSARATNAWVFCDPHNPSAGLPPLALAREEGAAVAGVYERSKLSCGEEATDAAVMEALATASVVHFAGHAVVDARNPWASRLVLSPTESNPRGLLRLQDIANAQARGGPRIAASLVVLGACSTARGNPEWYRGVVSLASAFRDLGVPWVVATQWDVQDAAARDLFVRLHATLAAGGFTPPAALAAAQRALIDAGVRPSAWAPFIALAGVQAPRPRQ